MLRRDKGLCLPGWKLGKIHVAREVDHIKSKALGGTDDLDNLQSICGECHATKTATERERG